MSIPRLLCCLALLATATLVACGPAPDNAPGMSRPTLAPAAPTVTHTNTPTSPVAAPATPTTDGALAGLRGEVRIDGSSTVFPITEAAARGFREQAPGVDLSLGVSGTGGGFARFCAGEIDISGASRPIKSSEEATCTANDIDFIELPIAYDGISVVVSAGNDWVECLTVAELGRMWAPRPRV